MASVSFETETIEMAKEILKSALANLEKAQSWVIVAQQKYWDAVSQRRSANNLVNIHNNEVRDIKSVENLSNISEKVSGVISVNNEPAKSSYNTLLPASLNHNLTRNNKDVIKNKDCSPSAILNNSDTLHTKKHLNNGKTINSLEFVLVDEVIFKNNDNDNLKNKLRLKRKLKACSLRLTRCDDEPAIKRQKYIKNKDNLVNHTNSIFLSAEILLKWIKIIWTLPARRGIKFINTKNIKNVKKTPKKLNSRKKSKKVTEASIEAEKLEKRREKDRIRKREKRLKEKSTKISLRVPLIRTETNTNQDIKLPQPELFTICTDCKKDCWYKGDNQHRMNWLLCVACHKNWANGECVGRIPYECRVCRRLRVTSLQRYPTVI